jgi:aquaporin Z
MSSATVTPGITEAVAVPHREAVAARKYVVELIGAFFLVFTVCATAFASGSLAPLAIGAALMVMIYAGGHISGGHYNPAVTVAALVRGRIGVGDAIGYWIAQFVGGALAALIARAVIPHGHVPTMALSGHLGAAFVVELLFTFALCWVVLNVATSRDQAVNSFYGLAIGFTVMTGAVAVGAVSGGAFNPAVALGASVMGLFAWSNLWLYLVAEVIAGVIAGLAFRALEPADK